MSIFLALFLGLVQGLTEFLPVSSSGHLMLFEQIFNLPNDMMFFNIILHLATLLAVVIVFRKKIWELIKRPFCKTNLMLVTSTAITCGLVLILKDFIDQIFSYKILPVTFLLTAVILYLTEIIKPKNRAINIYSAGAVGFTQFLAIIPGLSRSGTTISTLLISGAEKNEAAEYSFLMSIPIILASFVYEIIDTEVFTIEILPISVAFFAATVSGILAIKFMLSVIKRIQLKWFSLYLTLLSIICTFLLWF